LDRENSAEQTGNYLLDRLRIKSENGFAQK